MDEQEIASPAGLIAVAIKNAKVCGSGYLCDSGAGATGEVNPSVYLRYRVVKVFIGLVTPSLLPLESIDSTV